MKTELLVETIAAACEGLVYVSEIDAPIVPFFVKGSAGETSGAIIEKLKKDLGGCAETAFDEFFDRLTADRPWHTPQQKKNVKRFGELRTVLTSRLTGLGVLRCGGVRLEILVFGVDADGNLAGIRTRSVET